ncbi:MAG TPA: metallophosphoesterase [Thermoanaerobaculia bacterium]|nr:metallophosphoesterase [Thermoanaerobaculia bacterium]
MALRLLFLSDTHLGLDLPGRPRAERPRRGDDLFASFERALEPAVRGEAGVVVHGGDLFYRSRVPAWLAARVFARLADLADAGVDLFWVPGNHERGAVPRELLLTHPRVRVFDRPRTFLLSRDGVTLALAGFPYAPRIRDDAPALFGATGAASVPADVRLLCLHQAVEGATVGPWDFVFRSGVDVLRGRDVPPGFAALLSGHIHRSQVLARDLSGRPLAAPVLFAGSTDRVSFVERFEPKGAFLLQLSPDGSPGGRATWAFREHPVRPMAVVDLDPAPAGLSGRIDAALGRLEPRSLVRLRLLAEPPAESRTLLRPDALRARAPEGVDVSVAWPRPEGAAPRTAPSPVPAARSGRSRRAAPPGDAEAQLSFEPFRPSQPYGPPPRQATKRKRTE